MSEMDENPCCQFCGKAGDCEHLLLMIDDGPLNGSDGVLGALADALVDQFERIYAEVARREAVCGSGLLRAATTAYFNGFGYIAGTDQLHAELDRDFAKEYLLDALDCAPNIVRCTVDDDSRECEFFWTDLPDAARRIVVERLRELERLASLPLDSPEWVSIDYD